ncbi:hypothetical protein [Acinetobacter soli]|uniref:hypothetical protein n=1 Tax=Acinetobacter soli TaxID=487316 RepID=UPI00300C12A9
MWDILVTISTWAENNSGQIQIIIALVAIYMAFKGYQKVLEQISLSKKQAEDDYSQRNYELKVDAINLVLRIGDLMHLRLISLYEAQNAINNSLEDYNVDDIEYKKIEEIKIEINKSIDDAEDLLEKINISAKKLNKKENFDYKKFSLDIGIYYDALIVVNKSTNNMKIFLLNNFTEDR